LVARGRFYEDKCNIYKNLIRKEPRLCSKILLTNRLLCFKYGGIYSNKFLNSAFYLYALSSLANLFAIYKRHAAVKLSRDLHVQHYILINKAANKFIENLKEV